MNKIEAPLTLSSDNKVAVVVSRFNHFLVESLLNGTVDTLVRHGLPKENIDVVYVPGAYELPLAAKQLAERQSYDGIVALGLVIRGATAHFEYVAGNAINGLAKVSLDCNTPIGLGVLTTESIEQAIERCGTKAGNKGEEAALATIEMMNLGKVIRG